MTTAAATQRKHNRKARQRKSLALFVLGAGLLIMGVVVLLALIKRDASTAGPASPFKPAEVNYAAPELALTDLDGKAVSLADYLGKVVLVNNWATWCLPCREELPVLEAYYQDYREQDFVIIGIEAGEPVVQVETFVEGYQITYPVWPDLEKKALRAFRNDALPSSYAIDRDGNVRLVWAGLLNRAALDTYLTPLINE
jgi:peroxiredoxin